MLEIALVALAAAAMAACLTIAYLALQHSRKTYKSAMVVMAANNRALQASLMAYHASNPAVSAVAAKGLAEKILQDDERDAVPEQPKQPDPTPQGGRRFRVGG